MPDSAVQDALAAAWAANLTPLLIDATDPKKEQEFSPLETFWSYSGHELFEAKKMVVEVVINMTNHASLLRSPISPSRPPPSCLTIQVSMKKTKTVEDAREEQRVKLVRAMKQDKLFAVLMANGAPSFKSKLCSDDALPYDIFDAAAVGAAVAAVDPDLTPWVKNIVRSIEECAAIGSQFGVVVQTKFAPDDYADFLQKELPLNKMMHLVIVAES